MRLFVIARHGESTLNYENRVNGDPNVPVALTENGRDEARLLGKQLAHVPLDVCLHSRFERTLETARIALGDRQVPFVTEPLLDDIDIGELEGQTLDDYRAWKRTHLRSDRFPGGESLDDAARRYARAFRAVVARPEQTVLLVTHEIPLRYAINAADGSDDLDGPTHQLANATPYLFAEAALERAAAQIERLTTHAA
ncbi:MAG TPA: histidine phosphatase family protein [Gaiellaceae bacterium]|jgi:probable phosphoglycerate mutase|nr:histidine phosphatase family protein [Gaiellaceae bacterium]